MWEILLKIQFKNLLLNTTTQQTFLRKVKKVSRMMKLDHIFHSIQKKWINLCIKKIITPQKLPSLFNFFVKISGHNSSKLKNAIYILKNTHTHCSIGLTHNFFICHLIFFFLLLLKDCFCSQFQTYISTTKKLYVYVMNLKTDNKTTRVPSVLIV